MNLTVILDTINIFFYLPFLYCDFFFVFSLNLYFPFNLFNFLFYIGVWQINNVVIISGAQQSDSVIHIRVSILPQTPLPCRLPHNTEQSSLCYTVGPCWLSILNIAVCTCHFNDSFTSV